MPALTFNSILFRQGARQFSEPRDAPNFFVDLNLDQLVRAITAGKEEYDLGPLFYIPLDDVDDVLFRQEVMQDLHDACVVGIIDAFAARMRAVRGDLAQMGKLNRERQKQRWFVDAVDRYVDALSVLVTDLAAVPLRSRGLRGFKEYLARYTSSVSFVSLASATKQLKAALTEIRYTIFIRSPRVDVRRYAGESIYNPDLEAAFDLFLRDSTQDYTFVLKELQEMNHVEAKILDGVAQLHQATFSRLAAFCAANEMFFDAVVVRFDREIQFYLAYLGYIAPLKNVGLPFCYPAISETREGIYADDAFDSVLAALLAHDGRAPVRNDFRLDGAERIIVVSGPNQGGKTTFARAFGQLHYLAGLGCPVAAREARLYLFDRIFTHFERQERVATQRGKLEDDIVRVREIIGSASPRSIVIINEIFASTALHDAVQLSRTIVTELLKLDILCVWVTFLPEAIPEGDKTVSMVATVLPDDPAQRTFKIMRRPPNSIAYAMSLAEKHCLTYDKVKQRISHASASAQPTQHS